MTAEQYSRLLLNRRARGPAGLGEVPVWQQRWAGVGERASAAATVVHQAAERRRRRGAVERAWVRVAKAGWVGEVALGDVVAGTLTVHVTSSVVACALQRDQALVQREMRRLVPEVVRVRWVVGGAEGVGP